MRYSRYGKPMGNHLCTIERMINEQSNQRITSILFKLPLLFLILSSLSPFTTSHPIITHPFTYIYSYHSTSKSSLILSSLSLLSLTVSSLTLLPIPTAITRRANHLSSYHLSPYYHSPYHHSPFYLYLQLSLDEQIILRIAAVIGLIFSSDVLDSATPPPMRPYLNTILSSLVGGYWLTRRTIRQPLGVRFYYSFRHPSVRTILYDQVPEKFRGSTHLTIAEYLERACSKRGPKNSQYASSHHLSSPASHHSLSSLADLATGKKKDEKGGADDGVDTPIRYQHTLLCTAYHYRFPSPPPLP